MKSLSLIVIITLLAAVPASAQMVSVQWVDGNTVHEYVAVLDPAVSWEDARAKAQSLGSGWDLATVTSDAEREFISANLDDLVGGAFIEQLWLGGYQNPPDTPEPDANWTWVTGETWNYSYWWDSEPGDAYGPGSEQHLATSGNHWNDEGELDYISGFLAETTYELDRNLIGIDIKPGSAENRINPGSRGVVKVAILSQAGWDAPVMADRAGLTFGRTGDEASLASCNRGTSDVNGDGLQDLLCHFFMEKTGFEPGDVVGRLKGSELNGTAFVGTDFVDTVPR